MKNRRGLTLIELLVIAALFLIGVALTVPFWIRSVNLHRGRLLIEQGVFGQLGGELPLDRAVSLGGDLTITARRMLADDNGNTLLIIIEDGSKVLVVRTTSASFTSNEQVGLALALRDAVGQGNLWQRLGRQPKSIKLKVG